jgi:hypothetical protein
MEMIPQQAIGIRFGYRFDVAGVELEEIPIVALLNKEILPVDASVVDVVIPAVL